MKNLFCLSLIGLILGAGACKKEKATPCDGVVCQNGGTCVNGVCVCDSRWTGATCNEEIIPIDSFIGDYHMVGYRQTYYGPTTYPPDTLDQIITITKVSNAGLSIYGEVLIFRKSNWIDTVSHYSFIYPNGNAFEYKLISFKRPYANDTAIYQSRWLSAGGGSNTYLIGTKLH